MKEINSLLVVLLVSILFVSCIKSPFASSGVVLYGQIVDSTTKQPINNTTFYLIKFYPNGLAREHKVYPFTTDAQGNFKTNCTINTVDDICISFTGNPYGQIFWEKEAEFIPSSLNIGVISTKKP